MPFIPNKLICDTALSKVGKLEYKFGGDNIEGGVGDCSDFTQWVYSCYNVDIGGNTDAQYSKGVAVSKDDAKAGDLVFFKNTYKSNYTDGVSHVGIYLGDNKFVHLSNSGCKVSDLSERYYSNHLLGFRHMREVNSEVDVITDEMIENNAERYEHSEELKDAAGLEWWGDIVRVVLVLLIVGGGLVLLAMSAGQLGANVPSVSEFLKGSKGGK